MFFHYPAAGVMIEPGCVQSSVGFGGKELAVAEMAAELLFDVVATAYERNSVIVTTNLPFENWGKLFGDVPSATAILDRFLHHADVIAITGRSYRLQNRAADSTEAPAVQKEMLAHLPPPDKIENVPVLLNATAWIMVSSHDATLRDSKQMLEMARKACELTKYKNRTFLDTLAGASAECGDREGTLNWSHRIFELSGVSYKVQYYNALRFLWCDDLDQYHQAGSAMIKQFSTATDNDTRFWIAWTCARAGRNR